MIRKYGDHWERSKMFKVENGRVSWTDEAWPAVDPPLKGARGIYVLYQNDKPIYVGLAVGKNDSLAMRIQDHAKDWLAPWWNSVCWYDFGNEDDKVIKVVESMMISHCVGLWNGAESGQDLFGDQCFLAGDSFASNELWKTLI